MKKKTTLSMLVTSSVCLLPIVLSVILYSWLPSKIPVHFDASGHADNYYPKAIVCFLMPFAFALLNLFVHFVINSDPRKVNASEAMKTISRWIVPIISVICVPMSMFISLGMNIPIHIIVPLFVGIFIILCGIYLPKNGQNYTVGIKLPWTLYDEENWNKTHRMAGVLWIIGGVIIMITSFLQFINILVISLVAILLIVVPMVYSYILYRRGL